MAQGTPGFVVGQEFNPYKQYPGIFTPDPIARYRGLSGSAKLAYGRLVRYAGEDGNAFPAVGTLAAEIGVSISQARRYLKELTAGKFIKIVPNEGRQNNYKFLWHAAFEGDKGTVRQEAIRTLPLAPMTGVAVVEKENLPLAPMTGVPIAPMTVVPLAPMTAEENQCKRVSKELAGQTRARDKLGDDSYAREQFRLTVLDATKAGSISSQLANRMYSSALESTLPMDLIQQYMYELCKEKRELGDPIGPPVLALALEEKRYVQWLTKTENRNFMERCLRKREEREYLESLHGLKTARASA